MIRAQLFCLYLQFFISFFLLYLIFVLLIFLINLVAFSSFGKDSEESVWIRDIDVCKQMIIDGPVNMIWAFIKLIEVKRFVFNFLLLHQVRVVFVDPLYPPIFVKEEKMFLSKH